MTRVGSHSICIRHLNVYHLYNNSAPVHLFRINESSLDARITDNVISMNDYAVLRRDNNYPLHTGLVLHVTKSIVHTVRRRSDLKQ